MKATYMFSSLQPRFARLCENAEANGYANAVTAPKTVKDRSGTTSAPSLDLTFARRILSERSMNATFIEFETVSLAG
jgi:hypothetical protein